MSPAGGAAGGPSDGGPDRPALGMSVRELAERLFAAGSLGEAAPAGRAAELGARVHRRLQTRGIPGYEAEVELCRVFPGERIDLELIGRADGIYEKDGLTHVEEIKSTGRDPETIPEGGESAHAAPLGLYGWLFCLERGREAVALDLVYVGRAEGRERRFSRIASLGELEAAYGPALAGYLAGLDRREARRAALRGELAAFRFPFPAPRPGQREAAEEVYRAIRERRVLLLQAPTGIGKTMAVLYPALKALGRGLAEKLFYLTAKGEGAAAAEKALAAVSPALPSLSWITITAKARICFLLGGGGPGTDAARGPGAARVRPPCDPAACPYARGYFAKARAALGALVPAGGYSRSSVEELARRHEACPYELSLDLSLLCDLVIADYNYAFDPAVRLKRYFQAGRTDYVLLVDEAHNLVERARSMFSGALSKRRVLEARRSALPAERRILSSLNAVLLRLRKSGAAEPPEARESLPAGLAEAVGEAVDSFDALLECGATLSEAVLELYWELSRLRAVLERYDDSCRTLSSRSGGDLAFDFLCVDPSARLRETLGAQAAAVLFSGTLAPERYFARLLADGLDPLVVDIPSPFPPERCARIARVGISTLWRDRGPNMERYAREVEAAFAAVGGNLIVFSPSFAFQAALVGRLLGGRPAPAGWVVQAPGMDEAGRRAFVAAFEREGGVRGFAVAGGSFSESVDLVGERLVGVLVFGVGLPQVNAVNEAYRAFFDSRTGDGFAWAYVYPGLNRVVQAAGRVIRSETDVGFVYLVDDRYGSPEYRRLLPGDWDLRRVGSWEEAEALIPEALARRSDGQ